MGGRLDLTEAAHPHSGTRVAAWGVPLEEARAAAIFLHGRGATPEDILSLAAAVDPGGIAYLAPEASGRTWYPQTFLAQLEVNQPWLDSALRRVDELVESALAAGLSTDRVALLGFSQGGCLAVEYACRAARPYAAVVALSGGLIGPEVEEARYRGAFESTPALLGCSDVDPHIPLRRVERTGQVLQKLGAQTDVRIYPGMGHLVNEDELNAVAGLLAGLNPPT